MGLIPTMHKLIQLLEPQLGGMLSCLRHCHNQSKHFQDIQALGIDDKFLVSTFSEFGRKVQENGNYGTDHGGAAPMFYSAKV